MMNNSMFASVLNLDRKAVKELKITDPYSVHRVVYSLFEDMRNDEEKKSSKASGIVYADQGGTFHGRQILIVSDRVPAPCVQGQYGEVESKKIGESFLNFDSYRFKIAINPSRRDNNSRKLLPVKGRERIAQWFCQRSEENWGFASSNEHLQVDKIEVLQFKGKNGQPITLAKAVLQGVLHITDRTQFIQSFSQGIGRGRAFGCGLLQIVPQPKNSHIK